jgi:P4 family phage/plasmid primase-like protien
MRATDTTAKAAAVDYHRGGWCPIPIKERSKEPNLLELRPYLNRRATREELGAWAWSGVGIVTGEVSGVLVLDVDGPQGEAELRKHGHPATPMVRTASGGLHLYFKHPEHPVKTGIRVAPGLDVKASGGYVVAPPSVGPNGKRYEWIVSPEDADLAESPEWLMRLLGRQRSREPAGPVGERIPSGQRNKALASIAGTMRRRGMGEPEILAALQVTNEQRCEPPLDAEEVAKIAASVARYEPAGDVVHVSFNGHGSPRPPAGFNLTDLGNAERFIARHGENVRYCFPWRKWLVWTGARWERDDVGQVHQLAKETVRSIYREASEEEDEDRRKALAKHARGSESETRMRAMVELAKSERPASPDKLDASPWLLNVLNGTIDLRAGRLRDHRREDLITKLAPVEYAPDATAPTWESFFERVLPSEELRGFVQRAVGYSATGDTSEQCMFIHHGPGANGKSTFQETVSAALGDYAMRTPTETLLVKRSGGVPNDVARLKGARFVTASETEEGRRLAESLVKELTGQDTISARFMWAEWFDFKPTHALHLSTNHKPEIRGTDTAIWRRIRLVPWAVTIPPAEQDRKLSEKLRGELPGVLAWIVRGCSEWLRDGLMAPEEVREATRAYRAEMDVLAAFLADCCRRGQAEAAFAGELWNAWRRWCEATGEPEGTQKRFGGRLAERGFLNQRDTRTGRKMWTGLALRSDWESRAGLSLNHSSVRFAGNSESAEPSEPKNNNSLLNGVREEALSKKGSEGSEGSARPLSASLQSGESATLEQLQRIREFVGQGMSEARARTEVLGEHPVSCLCEECVSE